MHPNQCDHFLVFPLLPSLVPCLWSWSLRMSVGPGASSRITKCPSDKSEVERHSSMSHDMCLSPWQLVLHSNEERTCTRSLLSHPTRTPRLSHPTGTVDTEQDGAARHVIRVCASASSGSFGYSYASPRQINFCSSNLFTKLPCCWVERVWVRA